MAKFLYGTELNLAVERVIKNSTQSIFLVSPFIKLHNRIKEELRRKKGNPDIDIRILFGKNVDDPSQSLGKEDLDFFKDFCSVEIRYQENLHAKYYANEDEGILTSMNLYNYSQDNNIEFGVLVKTAGFFRGVTGDNVDYDAWEYFHSTFDSAEQIFKRVPNFEKALLGFQRKYKGSVDEVDNSTVFFKKNDRRNYRQTEKPIRNFRPNGFCIRTGRSIPFNPERPLSDEGYSVWSKYGDRNYPERFCHFSGEPSNGETSFEKPILRKNYSKAREIHGF